MIIVAGMATLGERVAAERERQNLTQADLAYKVTRLGFSMGQSAIYQIEKRGQSNPRSIVQLAQALGVAVRWLQTGEGEREPSAAEMPSGPPPLPSVVDMPRDVPILGTTVGGDSDMADFEMNGEIVDYARRPPRIAGRRDVFCLFVQGQSVSPWREPGQIVYAETNKPARSGDYCVIELKAKANDHIRPALIKRLVAITPTKLKLQQYTPARIFDIDRRLVFKVYRVIDWDELLGF